jgi:hypothetical protein
MRVAGRCRQQAHGICALGLPVFKISIESRQAARLGTMMLRPPAASSFKKMPNQKEIKAESKPNQKAQPQFKISDATPRILVYYFGNR